MSDFKGDARAPVAYDALCSDKVQGACLPVAGNMPAQSMHITEAQSLGRRWHRSGLVSMYSWDKGGLLEFADKGGRLPGQVPGLGYAKGLIQRPPAGTKVHSPATPTAPSHIGACHAG